MTYIIILSYNGAQDTIECIKSLTAIEEQIKIIIVDNASTDASVETLDKWIETQSYFSEEELTFIKSNENNGYAAGNNIGIKFVLSQNDAEFIWILNNDTIVDKNTLTELKKTHEHFRQNYKIGFIGSKILDFKQRNIIQSSGTNKNLFGKRIDYYANEDSSSLTTDFEVNDICGCSIFFSVETLKEIGLLPEEYFLYYEETDWMLKASMLGFYHFTSANSIVYHQAAKSTGGQLSPFVIYYMTRNRIIFNKKYKNRMFCLLFIFVYFNYSLFKALKYFFKDKKISRAIFFGLIDGIKEINKKSHIGRI